MKQELRGVPHERYVLSYLRLPHEPVDTPNDFADIDDESGHGTAMAGHVAGNYFGFGVAPKATVVEVVWGRGTTAEGEPTPQHMLPEHIAECWGWAVNDVNRKNRNGKAVFVEAWSKSHYRRSLRIAFCLGGCVVSGHVADVVLVYRFEELLRQDPNRGDPRYQRWNLPLPTYDDVWLPLLAEAWDHDIPTITAAGNQKSIRQGQRTPPRHSNARNPLIVAGALQWDGLIWDRPGHDDGTSPIGPGPQDPFLVGALDIMSIAQNVLTLGPGGSRFAPASGTSLAAADMAGLLAYFISLPDPFTLSAVGRGNFAFSAKQILAALVRREDPDPQLSSPDALGQAYNDIEAILAVCQRVRMAARGIDTNTNETAAIFWAEIGRRYWDAKGLSPAKPGLGSEAILEALKGAF